MIGAHYTYGNTPIGNTLAHIAGLERNIYDRIVHFCFGFLIFYPAQELFSKVSGIRGFWKYLLTFIFIAGCSGIYEVWEWINVRNLSPEVGMLYLGGNDVWDAQKDMAVSYMGALIALAVTSLRDFIKNRKVKAS